MKKEPIDINEVPINKITLDTFKTEPLYNTKVETLQHHDVMGKLQLYLKLTQEGKQPVLINVGTRTVEKINVLNHRP